MMTRKCELCGIECELTKHQFTSGQTWLTR